MRVKTPLATRPSRVLATGPAATGFSLQGRSALRIRLGIVSLIAAEVALGGNVRVGHATVRVDDSNCLSVNLGAASRLVLVLIAAHVEIERNARGAHQQSRAFAPYDPSLIPSPNSNRLS